jgi:tetratricopeptide (TPR) repeat protein
MRTHASLVICYSRMGLATKAAEAAEKAQALAPRVSDPEQLACMNINVTHSLFAQGRMDDALNAIRQAEIAYMALGWEIDAARAKINQGVVQIEKGDFDQARRNLTEAAETLKGGNHPADAAKAIDELGRLERLSGDDAAAERLLREAQGLLGQGDFAERALNLRELGLCLEDRDRDEAKGYLRRAIDLYLLAGANTQVAATYKLLGDLHRKAGETEQSADAYRAGIEAVEASIS